MAVVSDPISDFLIRFKNATMAQKEDFSAPYSKMKEELARILKEEGYLWSYEKVGEGHEARHHPPRKRPEQTIKLFHQDEQYAHFS